MTMLRFTALLSLASLAPAGCSSSNKIHLHGEESARNGDIQIDGATGKANWTWGTQRFSQDVEVIADNLIATGSGIGGGSLTLKLKDGTTLEFVSQQRAFACVAGCESTHLPMMWIIAK